MSATHFFSLTFVAAPFSTSSNDSSVDDDDVVSAVPASSVRATSFAAAAAVAAMVSGGGAALDRMVAMGSADLIARIRNCCLDCLMER